MASQNSSEAWEAYAGSFSLSEYDFVPTDQLLFQSQVWQSSSGPSQLELIEDPDLSSGDEVDFTMDVNQEPGRIAKEAPENFDEEHVEHVPGPATSHRLPQLSDFQPLRGKNHLCSWRLSYEFGSSPRVSPLQGCTADHTCSHAGHGKNCANTTTNSGDLIEDR